MKLDPEDAKEIFELSQSRALRDDLRAVRAQRHNPFMKDGRPDIDAYIEFVTQYNEFINHQPKPFKPIILKNPVF